MNILARIRKLENQMDALISLNQERNCKEGRHKLGEIVYSHFSHGNPWIRCPACYANLSNPELLAKK